MFFRCNLKSAKKAGAEQFSSYSTPTIDKEPKKSPKEQITKDQFKTGLFGGANQI